MARKSTSADTILAGSLLVAHPSLLDPNFRKTIIFISEHDPETGATGFVLNRPLRKFSGDGLDVPVFYGGPVGCEACLLASIEWRENPALVAFRAFPDLGDSESVAGWEKGLRIFEGYSGWTAGQLENEIQQNAWIVIPPSRTLIEMPDPESAWRSVMRNSGPFLHLLSDAPDNPSLN